MQLKHILTGRFLILSEKSGNLELVDDLGTYKNYLRSYKSTIQNRYKKAYNQYNEILEDEKIRNKEEVIDKKFTSSMIKLFKETDSIVEGENRFANQYLRDTAIILKSVNNGG